MKLDYAEIVTNVETLGAVATKTWTVPANKRWIVFGGYAERDVAATLDLKVTDSADKTIKIMPQIAAGVTNIGFGNFATDTTWHFEPFPLDEGMKIVLTWGAGQTTPEIALLVLQIEKIPQGGGHLEDSAKVAIARLVCGTAILLGSGYLHVNSFYQAISLFLLGVPVEYIQTLKKMETET